MEYYAILSYAMVWYGEYAMQWDFYAMPRELYAMLSYGLYCKIDVKFCTFYWNKKSLSIIDISLKWTPFLAL